MAGDASRRDPPRLPARRRAAASRADAARADLHYLFAPLKQARLDYMVQKAVEMGAGRLRPVLTQHTQVARVNLERMRANVDRGGRAMRHPGASPRSTSRRSSHEVLDRLGSARERLVFCDEDAPVGRTRASLRSAATRRAARGPGRPGGRLLAPKSAQRLRAVPCVTPLSLGPRILRADTAAVAALALVQAVIGDWR